MPISQTEGYFENPYGRTYALSIDFKMESLRKNKNKMKTSKTKTNSYFAKILQQKDALVTRFSEYHPTVCFVI